MTLEAVRHLNGVEDYGIYQIYGTHSVLGSDALLYIGLAEQRTFGARVSEHQEWIDWEPGNISIYLGRLGGIDPMTQAKWDDWAGGIIAAEKLLIYFCSPPYNGRGVQNLEVAAPTIVLNFRRYHRLPRVVTNLYNVSPALESAFKVFSG
jgi:hypothetical protein